MTGSKQKLEDKLKFTPDLEDFYLKQDANLIELWKTVEKAFKSISGISCKEHIGRIEISGAKAPIMYFSPDRRMEVYKAMLILIQDLRQNCSIGYHGSLYGVEPHGSAHHCDWAVKNLFKGTPRLEFCLGADWGNRHLTFNLADSTIETSEDRPFSKKQRAALYKVLEPYLTPEINIDEY